MSHWESRFRKRKVEEKVASVALYSFLYPLFLNFLVPFSSLLLLRLFLPSLFPHSLLPFSPFTSFSCLTFHNPLPDTLSTWAGPLRAAFESVCGWQQRRSGHRGKCTMKCSQGMRGTEFAPGQASLSQAKERVASTAQNKYVQLFANLVHTQPVKSSNLQSRIFSDIIFIT